MRCGCLQPGSALVHVASMCRIGCESRDLCRLRGSELECADSDVVVDLACGGRRDREPDAEVAECEIGRVGRFPAVSNAVVWAKWRMCPWRSTSMVQVMLSTRPPVSCGCETVNLYRVPVQPGPDTGPSSWSDLASELSSARTACGSNGRLELKSHASNPAGDLYGRPSSTAHRGVSVQSLPAVPNCLVWEGRIFVYAFPPMMRVRHPLEIVSWPRFRFRSSSPVMRSGEGRRGWAGVVVTVRFMPKLSDPARDSAPVLRVAAAERAQQAVDGRWVVGLGLEGACQQAPGLAGLVDVNVFHHSAHAEADGLAVAGAPSRQPRDGAGSDQSACECLQSGGHGS
jgi:hypothetical protein